MTNFALERLSGQMLNGYVCAKCRKGYRAWVSSSLNADTQRITLSCGSTGCTLVQVELSGVEVVASESVGHLVASKLREALEGPGEQVEHVEAPPSVPSLPKEVEREVDPNVLPDRRGESEF